MIQFLSAIQDTTTLQIILATIVLKTAPLAMLLQIGRLFSAKNVIQLHGLMLPPFLVKVFLYAVPPLITISPITVAINAP